MRKENSYWIKTIQSGLIGGAISLLLCLVGLVFAFNTKFSFIISGIFTMGYVFAFAPILFLAYQLVRKAPTQNTLALFGIGGLAGLMSGIILVIAIALQQLINIRAVLINWSPDLIKMLTFGLPLSAGLPALLGACLVFGLVSTGLYLLPARIRGAVLQGVMIVITLGLFRDLLVTVINLWGVVSKGFLWLFADSGMSIPGAIVVFLLMGGIYYWRQGRVGKQGLLVRTPRQQQMVRWGVLGILVVLALLVPPLLGSYFSEIFDQVGIYVLMGLGLNIVVGFAGLLDLGYVAFYAIGAYTLGVFTTSEAVGLLHLSFWSAAPIAIIVAVFAGVILGLPVLRMRGDYLAIVTLGFGEIIRIVVLSDWLKPQLGGSEGIQRIAQPSIGSLIFNNQQKLYYVIVVGIVIAGFIATRLKDSHLGRSWMALREDEDVAQAMGINKVATKLLAFAMGALFSGLGGALFATKIGSVYPQSFNFIVSINILSLIIIGGMGSIPGVFVGGFALVGLPLLLSQFADYKYLLYGALLVFMMLVRPEGLSPEARRKLELHEETGVQVGEEPSTVMKTPGQ